MNHGKHATRFSSAAIALALLLGALAGCTPAQNEATPAPDTAVASSGSAGSEEGGGSEAPPSDGRLEELQFPIVEEPITLTWFYELDGKTSTTKTSFAEVAAYQQVMEKTGITIEFQHPPVGQFREQFNLMMASADLADIVTYNWRNDYPGGATKAIGEGLILPLNDLIENYAPNIRRIIAEYPELAKDMRTDEGYYFGFPDGSYAMYPRSDENKPAFKTHGWQIRKDWLEKLGLEMPETIDDWYEVLTAFKTGDPNGNGVADEIPLTHQNNGNDVNQWLRAWGAHYEFYVDNDVVKYGTYEPVYEEFLATMNQWYEEGLLDVDYVTNDAKQFDAKISGSLAGAWTGSTSGTLGRFVQLMQEREPGSYLTGTVPPYVAGGTSYNFDAASFFPVEGNAAVISAKCQYPEAAVQLLDIGYSDEGDALYNWGIEGISYTNDNGVFTLTEHITNNEEGLSLDQALAQYAPGANNGPMFKPNSLWNQRMWMPEQQEAVANWSVGSGERILPPVSLLPEESTEVAEILSRVKTYNEEMLHKFIMGVVPLSEYESYVSNQKDMGIEDAIAIYQTAYERYQSR